jgi:small-conductance mechanosensitive channel
LLLQSSVGETNSTATATAVSGGHILFVAAEVAFAMALIFVLWLTLTRLGRRVALRAGASKSVARTADLWIGVLMVVLAITVFAGLTGISSEFTTLTLSGIAGLAASLALQTTLSNIISGMLMLQDGILRLGDDVEFGSVRGEVVRLSLRTTWLKRRQDGAIIVVGNSNLAGGPIINYTARERLSRKAEG